MKKNILLLVLFTFIFGIFYGLLKIDKDERINELLQEESKYLEISYRQGLDRFHVIGENIYISLQNDQNFIDILANVDKKGLDKTHEALYKHIKDEFNRLEQLGVMGLQVVLPNNVSVLRMHKVDKYGDDLTPVRYSLEYTNKLKTHLHGFEEGRTSHAFRELYPLFKEGKHIGVMEVLFSSTRLQDYTMRASDIHTHFLVDKNVFKTNEWKANSREPYRQSIEHQDYLFSLNDHMRHARLDKSNKTLITPLRDEIDKGIAKQEAFEVYKKLDGTVKIVTFLPVKRIKNDKVVAYLVSYTSSDKMYSLLYRYNISLLFLFIFILILYAISMKISQTNDTMKLELQYDGLTNVYNRKYFMTFAAKEFAYLNSENSDFTIVMVDVDFFKHVNDDYGHQYGDEVLVGLAKILKDSVCTLDKVARYGGEEFIMLLLTNEERAFTIVEKMREIIQTTEFGKKQLKVTASFGIAQYKNDSSLEHIIKRADSALYKAKEEGRNQTQIL